MSGSGVTESELVREDTSGVEAVAGLTVGLSALLFGLGFAALLELVPITRRVAGVGVTTVLGLLLFVVGVAVIAFGVGSRLDLVETDPQPSAGLVAASAFAAVWFAIGVLVASQTLGLGTAGTLLLAAVLGVAGFVTSALPREDVGSTLPAGAVAVLGAAALATGLIGPGWAWMPGFTRATFDAPLVVPVVVQFSALLVGWAGAKAYGGFGARGRHMGAYLLVYLNVLAILSVLAALVLFVLVRGAPSLFRGLRFGPGVGPGTTVALLGFQFRLALPVQWPFVMNGVSLLAEYPGVVPAIVGTFWLVVGAVVFAVPVGVGAAVFLSEYAREGRFTQVVEIATNGLWSTPSIVFGLFGAAFLIPRFSGTKSLVAGMLTLGFMLLPLVVITSREAMLAVPDEYRDASAALGVSRWQTVRSVVLPAAVPGITTGIILGVGRIAGETAPILLTMTGGVLVSGSSTADVIGTFEFTSTPPFVSNTALMESTTALPYQLFALIQAGLGKQSGALENPTDFAWGVALVLLLVVLSFYAVGIATRYYFRKKLHQ